MKKNKLMSRRTAKLNYLSPMTLSMLRAIGLGIALGTISHLIKDNKQAHYEDESCIFGPPSVDDESIDLVKLEMMRSSHILRKRRVHCHRGTRCNSCGISPIMGLRYRCCQCVDFDLCADCAVDGHDPSHILVLIKIPIPMKKSPQWIIPHWLPESSLALKITEPLSTEEALSWAAKYNMDLHSIHEIYYRFCLYADTVTDDIEGANKYSISRSTMEYIFCPPNTSSSPIWMRVFELMDQDDDDMVNFEDFLHYCQRFESNRALLVSDIFEIDISDREISSQKVDQIKHLIAFYIRYKRSLTFVREPIGAVAEFKSSSVASNRPLVTMVSEEMPDMTFEMPRPKRTYADFREDKPVENKLNEEFSNYSWANRIKLWSDGRYDVSEETEIEVKDLILCNLLDAFGIYSTEFYASRMRRKNAERDFNMHFLKEISDFVKCFYI